MLFLNNEYDPSSERILSYLKREIDVTVLNYVSPENIKTIQFDDFKIIFIKSQFKIKDYNNLVEYGEIIHFLNYLFGKSTITLFGQNFFSQPSKQKVLDIAKKIGFNVPEYIVVNSKSKLSEFVSRKGRVICKSLESQALYSFKGQPSERYNCFAYEISGLDLSRLPDNFFPSFFQEFVQRDMELKVFYFKGAFFPAALIPNHQDASTDIKASTYRCVPCFLSDNLKTQIHLLMTFFSWKMGSVDLIIKNDDYYFLEVNPCGQFGNISYECGYDIEAHIANEIISDYKK